MPRRAPSQTIPPSASRPSSPVGGDDDEASFLSLRILRVVAIFNGQHSLFTEPIFR